MHIINKGSIKSRHRLDQRSTELRGMEKLEDTIYLRTSVRTKCWLTPLPNEEKVLNIGTDDYASFLLARVVAMKEFNYQDGEIKMGKA